MILPTADFMALLSTVPIMTLTYEILRSFHTLPMATASLGMLLQPVGFVQAITEPWLAWRSRVVVMEGRE